ncbi:ImmA/IrrE family metallo-endopeptidase [Bradyrhizobium sp. AUGA SZCCT0177]|uniref:ImmA/IrrE family metallo-endopeptidase n=1 Tax=Bradyrhizobium sp. AUGA SZCCT0177 TaxID=2807665 RepID=UPI001BA7EF43|nr:ImmA/IrrE family metallo-endopeptidase [Bradyrhizobium sp. AUGA SZCCT0177]MBR1285973.1 ImmA/IrrE family metallo-endopeptidase [Bradyrhizobium sp. AUGA SZCCT0177]
MTNTSILNAVFGEESSGETPGQRAATSKKLFVRSQHQLSEYREGATGRVVNAQEALRLVGWETLEVLGDRPSVPLIIRAGEPYNSIYEQLRHLGLELSEIARKIGWSKETTRRFEEKKQIPFREIERFVRTIGLDSEKLGVEAGAAANSETGVRLRTYRNKDPKVFTVSTVLALAEASWTIQKQFELANLLGRQNGSVVRSLGFEPSSEYGGQLTRTFMEGYRLARRARELLGIPPDHPIASMKELIEAKLRIPVIQLEIHSELAGATIAVGSHRGVAINLKGQNSSPLARRMTMAHELGHLLWDPDQRLKRLVVDRYDSLVDGPAASRLALDAVERRANAFAIEFLAPASAILKLFESSGGGVDGFKAVIATFGVSRTAVANHLMNASHNRIDMLGQKLEQFSDDEWEAVESLAVPVFDPQRVPISRRGRFASHVLGAVDRELISRDTAASLYSCNLSELDRALKSTRNYVGPLD